MGRCPTSTRSDFRIPRVGGARPRLASGSRSGVHLENLFFFFQRSTSVLLRRLNPYAEFSYDGAALNPLEVLFIKVKSFTLDGEWAAPKQAVQYARWMDAEVNRFPSPSLYLVP